MTTTTRDRAADVRAHAAECGALDCGHLSKSADGAVRRAVILYACEAAGAAIQDDREAADVLTVLAVLREAQTAPVYTRRENGRNYTQTAPVPGVTLLPDVTSMIWTPERLRVATLYARGMSARQIGETVQRSIDTIVSHMGWIRRRAGAHSMLDVIVSAVVNGRISLYGSDPTDDVEDDLEIEDTDTEE